jgi:RNA polymerase sigma-70 factor (ECF subfamily)
VGTFSGSLVLSLGVEDQVRAAQRGDPAAVDALLGELAPWIGRICGAIALDRGADAMQESLITILRNLPTLREPAAFRAWARRIAVRQALRQVGHEREVLVAELPEVAKVSDLDTGIDVRATLAALTPHQRALLVLRDLEDLSERDAAAVLGVELGTVKSGLHRARDAFKERWDP